MGNGKRARGIYKTSSALLLTKGVLFSGALAVFAEPISRIVGNPQAYFAVLAISPALFFTCAAGAVRGYFQGCRLMSPTAISQLIEAACKLLLGVTFAAVAMGMGLGIAVSAALAVLGVSVGSLISALYLWRKKRADASLKANVTGTEEKVSKYFFELLRISLPITVCSALIGVTRIIDMTLLLRRLQDLGVSAAEANRIYGSYTTLALPVYSLVPAFIPPITESLIPRLAAAVQSGSRAEQTRAVSGAMRLTVFLGMPASMGIALYSRQILSLLFAGQTEAISISAPLLSSLAISVLFSCIITTTNAVLQSYKKVLLPILSLCVGAIVKAVSAYVLVGNEQIAALGAPMSTLLSNAAVLILNFVFVSRTVAGRTGMLSELPKPFFASLVAMVSSYTVFLPLVRADVGQTPAFIIAFCVAVAVYLVLAVALGVVSKDDITVFKRTTKVK